MIDLNKTECQVLNTVTKAFGIIGCFMSPNQVAELTGLSVSYTRKILNKLAKQGLIHKDDVSGCYRAL